MFVLKIALACARYVIGFVLLLGAATAINVGIVLGWNALSPDSFSRTVSLAVEAVDSVADRGGSEGSPGVQGPIRHASSFASSVSAPH